MVFCFTLKQGAGQKNSFSGGEPRSAFSYPQSAGRLEAHLRVSPISESGLPPG